MANINIDEEIILSNYIYNVKDIIEYRFADCQFDYILELYSGESLKVTKYVKEFAELCKDTNSFDQLQSKWFNLYHSDISREDLNYRVHKLIDKQILVKDKVDNKPWKYLKFETFLLTLNIPCSKWIYILLKNFVIMYKVRFLSLVFFLLFFSFIGYMDPLYYYFPIWKNPLIIYLLIIASCIFHEIGHITACMKYGIQIKAIGIGMYLIYPHFFIKIDPHFYFLSSKKKMVIDLGGIYFQMIFVLFLTLLNHIIKSGDVLYAIINIFTIILFNLNPFFRFDAYWILTDYFDCININGMFLNTLKYFKFKNLKDKLYLKKFIFSLFYILINIFMLSYSISI